MERYLITRQLEQAEARRNVPPLPLLPGQKQTPGGELSEMDKIRAEFDK